MSNLFKAVFVLAYYGLMRMGELVKGVGDHALKAKNIHVGMNKNKILMILYSSKMHDQANAPQKIRISALDGTYDFGVRRIFCPFTIVRTYAISRGGFDSDDEPFMIYKDKKSQPSMDVVRSLLRELLSALNLEAAYYDTHSFRIGRLVDVI